MQAALVGRTQPFTPAWYAEHPTAWQAPHAEADCWTCAGTADVRGFLAVPVAPASGSAAPVPSTASTDPEWMPLGVFATAPHGAEQAHAYQQLAVSHSGALKGNYYDAVADAVHPITGSIDQATRKAAWTVGKGARFETTLDALLQTASDVTMKAGSSTQTWQLVQMDKPPSATAKP